MASRFVVERGQGRIRAEVEELAITRRGDAERAPSGLYRVTLGEERLELDVRQIAKGAYHLLHRGEGHDGEGHSITVEHQAGQTTVRHPDGRSVRVRVLDEAAAGRSEAVPSEVTTTRTVGLTVRAPMPGRVVCALVAQGQRVSAGQAVIIVEAMKMQNELRAAAGGTVREVRVSEGDSVEAGAALVIID